MNFRLSLALLTVMLIGCGRSPTPPLPPPKPASQTAPPTAPSTPPTVDDRLPQALALKRDGKLAEARALLQDIAASTNVAGQVLASLGEINTQVIFSTVPAPEKVDHTVASGDALGKLATKYNTTIDLIKRSNNHASDVIRIGDRLRIYQGKFAVEVSKSANTLTLTDNGRFFKRYRVGTGEHSKTPNGDFKVATRLVNPPWYRSDGKTIPYGDPENILGTHWLGLNVRGYGIHGTWETNSIGKQASAGCVRLLNDDVAELFILLPVGTPVTIHD